jgi:hypothetical protein
LTLDLNSTEDFQSSLTSIISPLLTRAKRADKPNLDKEYLKIRAPNIIEFVTSQQYLNIPSVFKHTRQYQVLRDFYQYRCPICNPSSPEAIDCWNKTRTYLESENLLVWSHKYSDDECPKCNTTRQEFIQDGLLLKYNQLHGIVGMRSGKTATVGMVGSWVEHILITTALNQPDGRLSSYFGLLPNQPFEVTYIASTEVQSSDTIWAYYRSMRNDSVWFKRYIEWVKKYEKDQDTPHGMERWSYKETTREIDNGHLNVKFNSKNSNSSGLAGRTRIASFIDELCRFKQTESSLGAEESYRVMENSLRTVRSSVMNRDLLNWFGLMASISSPISVDDKGMELLYQSTDIKSMYAFHFATWEFNPDEKREYYDEAFEKDPVGTERDFGAKPPLAANPLIINPEKFEERVVDVALKATAEIEIIPFIDKTGQRYLKALMSSCQLRRDASRYACFDAGQNFDSFAGACGHLEIKETEDGNLEYVSVIDWVLRILPTEDMEVWFDSCVDLIKFQLKHQKLAYVEFDRWNSVTLIQQIRNLGIRAEQKSLKPDHFIKFVADSHLGRIKLLAKQPDDDQLDPPFKSAAAVGLYELERLERSIDDKKIYNPQKGKRRGYNSDDVARVLVHLHWMLQDSQIMPTGAKIRSREARLKRETIGSEQFQFSGMGSLYNPNRHSNVAAFSKRRW